MTTKTSTVRTVFLSLFAIALLGMGGVAFSGEIDESSVLSNGMYDQQRGPTTNDLDSIHAAYPTEYTGQPAVVQPYDEQLGPTTEQLDMIQRAYPTAQTGYGAIVEPYDEQRGPTVEQLDRIHGE